MGQKSSPHNISFHNKSDRQEISDTETGRRDMACSRPPKQLWWVQDSNPSCWLQRQIFQLKTQSIEGKPRRLHGNRSSILLNSYHFTLPITLQSIFIFVLQMGKQAQIGEIASSRSHTSDCAHCYIFLVSWRREAREQDSGNIQLALFQGENLN